MRMKIRLDTFSDVNKLVKIANSIGGNESITVTDGNGLRVNAKSFLGAVAATEFNELWLETENEHYHEFRELMQIED